MPNLETRQQVAAEIKRTMGKKPHVYGYGGQSLIDWYDKAALVLALTTKPCAPCSSLTVTENGETPEVVCSAAQDIILMNSSKGPYDTCVFSSD